MLPVKILIFDVLKILDKIITPLTIIKFPDIYRFSRLVATMALCYYVHYTLKYYALSVESWKFNLELRVATYVGKQKNYRLTVTIIFGLFLFKF